MKRLRVFAGPNGSGKSTIIQVVKDAGVHLGTYVNADDYKKEINANHSFRFSELGISWSKKDFIEAYKLAEKLYVQSDGDRLVSLLAFDEQGFSLPTDYTVNDYFTSFLASYVRSHLLECSAKFTFETVMSHPSKLDFIRKAHDAGYKVYLYFVSLSDPTLNENRVQQRVRMGGHDVPAEKIRERYYRTMDLLIDAIHLSDKVYIFDNSYSEPKLFARVENDMLSINEEVDFVPTWFKTYVLDKLE